LFGTPIQFLGMGEPLSRTSVADQVFARLREAILAGRYAPGERLPTQRALAADLRVNIATVREALMRLAQLRLVEVRHGDAMRVLDWRRSGGLEALVLLGSIDGEIVGALFEARRLLLVQAARLAAGRRDEEQAELIEELAQSFLAAGDEQTALLCDWAFMTALVEAADNLVFQLIMNSVRELYLPHAERFLALVKRREELAPLYLMVAERVRAGDGEAAAAAIGELACAQESDMIERLP
jgi:GntR family transcriptional regulator, transcriptional repressor for pyruvate dehydrogenase complex